MKNLVKIAVIVLFTVVSCTKDEMIEERTAATEENQLRSTEFTSRVDGSKVNILEVKDNSFLEPTSIDAAIKVAWEFENNTGYLELNGFQILLGDENYNPYKNTGTFLGGADVGKDTREHYLIISTYARVKSMKLTLFIIPITPQFTIFTPDVSYQGLALKDNEFHFNYGEMELEYDCSKIKNPDEVCECNSGIPDWVPYRAYPKGSYVLYNGLVYENISYVNLGVVDPEKNPLWQERGTIEDENYPILEENCDSYEVWNPENTYNIGDKVFHKKGIYEVHTKTHTKLAPNEEYGFKFLGVCNCS
ncbi:hypothetical protein [Aureivirga sp. CE67]|uniref:hypothetical protein n=1 Tax=Aureivirga sp. CE67 TaxID=1788983 RepID=UPI0018C990FA|nr:hypothetical protein [Aureivirga sp. CE67]